LDGGIGVLALPAEEVFSAVGTTSRQYNNLSANPQHPFITHILDQ
jgi:hypothetical protein